MGKIAIIATGGTIAGVGNKGMSTQYVAGKIGIEEVIRSIDIINEKFDIECYSLFNVDSNEMCPDKWIQLSTKIDELAKRRDIDGIVVTHGTDTIEETAYYLTLTIDTTKPVVLTGAMRPASATSADGPFNLYQALNLASYPLAINQGVLVLFGSTIYSARDVQKINNFKIDAFTSKNGGSIGYMQDDSIFLLTQPFKKHTQRSIFHHVKELPNVGIAYFYAGASPQILYDLAKYNQGIVLIGSGNGNYNHAWLHAINDLSNQGIVFVRSSRVAEGIVFEDNIFDPENNCIVSNSLSGQKARVLLMLALSQNFTNKQIKLVFDEY